MTTRRNILKGGAGLAALLASGKAPAYIVKPMLAARQGIFIGERTPQDEYWGLCFTAEEAGAVVNMTKVGAAPAVSLESSLDGITWTTFDADGGTTPITLTNIGDKVYFRAGSAGNTRFASSNTKYHSFTLSKKVSASGSIMSLINGETPTS